MNEIVAPDRPACAVEGLWGELWSTASPVAREGLILHYASLVRFVASKLAAGLPRHVERADLISYGLFGLIDAIDAFDPARNVKFETYAIPRIRGAVLDELRSLDWVPRSVRTRVREVERAYADLENELHRAPTDLELARHTGMELTRLRHVLTEASRGGIAALEQVLAGQEESERLTFADVVSSADRLGDPAEAFDRAEMKVILRQVVGRLTERERTVLTLYYFEGMTLAQIGQVLGVTESRVCQIHGKALLGARSLLREAIYAGA